MKKLAMITLALAFVVGVAASSFAATTATTAATASASNALAIAFAPITDGPSTNGAAISFTVDAADYAAGWAPADQFVSGKSEVGVYCYDNSGSTWYLKMNIVDAALGGNLSTVGVYRYINGATLRNTGGGANGTVVDNGVWSKIPTLSTTVYTSGANDTNNTPLGTGIFVGYSLQDLTGLASGVAYSSTITYTITETA
ncbi:MAG: hypothetical protein ABIJ27_08760 [Candidatus Omnitrophota bacterium]